MNNHLTALSFLRSNSIASNSISTYIDNIYKMAFFTSKLKKLMGKMIFSKFAI